MMAKGTYAIITLATKGPRQRLRAGCRRATPRSVQEPTDQPYGVPRLRLPAIPRGQT